MTNLNNNKNENKNGVMNRIKSWFKKNENYSKNGIANNKMLYNSGINMSNNTNNKLVPRPGSLPLRPVN